MTDFVGAKAALIWQGRILTYQRDLKAGLPWPGLWDLPGGGREGNESAPQCLLREVKEEFGLSLAPSCLIWNAVFPAMGNPAQSAVFFAGHLTTEQVCAIRFGDEGQGWEMMTLPDWLNHSGVVPQLQNRTALALSAVPGLGQP